MITGPRRFAAVRSATLLVIVREDGSATYLFASAVDDAELGITHVIPGHYVAPTNQPAGRLPRPPPHRLAVVGVQGAVAPGRMTLDSTTIVLLGMARRPKLGLGGGHAAPSRALPVMLTGRATAMAPTRCSCGQASDASD